MNLPRMSAATTRLLLPLLVLLRLGQVPFPFAVRALLPMFCAAATSTRNCRGIAREHRVHNGASNRL